MKKDCSFTTGACSGQGWEQKEKKKTAKWGFVPILCVAGEALLSLCPERGDFSWNLYSVHICCSLAALVSKPENIGIAFIPLTAQLAPRQGTGPSLYTLTHALCAGQCMHTYAHTHTHTHSDTHTHLSLGPPASCESPPTPQLLPACLPLTSWSHHTGLPVAQTCEVPLHFGHTQQSAAACSKWQ